MRLDRVVADDLTGACDVGGELVGLRSAVIVRSVGGAPAAWSTEEVVEVQNTQSRGVGAGEAAQRVRRAFGRLPLGPQECALKKIDTALRGHVAVELGAAIDVLRPALVLVAAAIPEVGRTTEGGVQRVDGAPVAETAFARDPLTPVRDSDLVTLLRSAGLDVAHAPLATVRDEGRYAALVGRLRARRGRVLVADAVTQDDLERSVRAVMAADGSLLVVGSIAVTRALARALGVRQPLPVTLGGAAADGRVLVVVGSAHPVAGAQVRAVEARHGIVPCEVGIAAPDAAAELVGGIVKASGLAVLVPQAGGEPRAMVQALGEAASAVLRRTRPGGLILIGGETAYHCLEMLDGATLRIEARPWPLVVAATIASGPLTGMWVLCKGGSAGEAETLNEMIALLGPGRPRS